MTGDRRAGDRRARVLALYAQGIPTPAIATRLGLHRGTVRQWLREAGHELPRHPKLPIGAWGPGASRGIASQGRGVQETGDRDNEVSLEEP